MQKDIPPDIAPAKTDYHLSGMLRYVAGHVYQVIDYSSMPAALNGLFKPWIFLPESFLAYHAQDVEGKH